MAPGFGRKNCPSPADGVCSRLCPAGTKLPVAVAPREKGMEDPPPRAAEVQQPLSTSCPVQTPFARAVLATEACWPPRMVSVTFAVTKGPASPDAVSSMDEHVNPPTGATAAAVTGAVMANPRPSWAGVIQTEPLLARTTPPPQWLFIPAGSRRQLVGIWSQGVLRCFPAPKTSLAGAAPQRWRSQSLCRRVRQSGEWGWR